MRKLLKWFLLGVACLMVMAILIVAFFDAMEREDKMRDQQRKDRCSSFGETLPPEWVDYCKDQ